MVSLRARAGIFGLILAVAPAVGAQTQKMSRQAPASHVRAPLTVKQIVQRESPAIVAIFNLDQKGEPQAAGTGFIVKPDGVIVTNYHVIDGASDALVKLKSGEVYDHVMVVDADERRDVAVLKVKAIDLPTVTLGNSAAVEPGDAAVAIGNPQGFDFTVSNGIISARRVDVPGMEGTAVFQITAPISHGSSGGPLYNERGEVIGITSAAWVKDQSQNINFAVDIKYAKLMIDGPVQMSLAQLTSRNAKPAEQPAPAPAPSQPAATAPSQPASSGDEFVSHPAGTYTDPDNTATVTLEQGWVVGKSDSGNNDVIMYITKEGSVFQVTRTTKSSPADVYTWGAQIVDQISTPRKPPLDLTNEGATVDKLHFVKTKDGDIDIFVGGIRTERNAELLVMGFVDANATDEVRQLQEIASMFFSFK
ncbi:MAG: S1C family serine protease [Candidatus Acidiferrales bacterium]